MWNNNKPQKHCINFLKDPANSLHTSLLLMLSVFTFKYRSIFLSAVSHLFKPSLQCNETRAHGVNVTEHKVQHFTSQLDLPDKALTWTKPFQTRETNKNATQNTDTIQHTVLLDCQHGEFSISSRFHSIEESNRLQRYFRRDISLLLLGKPGGILYDQLRIGLSGTGARNTLQRQDLDVRALYILARRHISGLGPHLSLRPSIYLFYLVSMFAYYY